MKKRLALLIAITFVITALSGLFMPNAVAVQAAVEDPDAQAVAAAPVNIAVTTATVTATMLNVRQGPSTKYPVVCKLKKGQTVKVFGKVGSWYAVHDSKKGCIGVASAKYLKLRTGATATTATNKVSTPSTTTTPQTSKIAGVSTDEQTLLNYVNSARKSAGVAALKFDMNLVKVARLKAKDMVDKNYFSHQSPTYGSPFDMMKQYGISFKTAGENIAGNQTVKGAFDAWMRSAGHKRNILNGSFNYCGFGIAASKTYGKILVQQFIGK